MSGRPVRMYHPSHHVPDLAEAEEFFQRVFGRTSKRLASIATSPEAASALGYSTFTMIADVLFDSIDPARYRVAGRQAYPSVERPRLSAMGWYVDGVADFHSVMRSKGYAVLDQLDRVCDGPDVPTAAGSRMPLFFSSPADAGLRYEFVPEMPFPLDPRREAGWTVPPVTDDDPLGIVRCAEHIVVSARPERAVRFLAEVLSGEVVAQGHDVVLDSRSTSVTVADATITVVESASPVTRMSTDADEYHALTWEVADLGRVRRHLRSVGVAVNEADATTIVADPATALGIPWRFRAS